MPFTHADLDDVDHQLSQAQSLIARQVERVAELRQKNSPADAAQKLLDLLEEVRDHLLKHRDIILRWLEQPGTEL